MNEIGQAYGVHPGQVTQWEKAILDQAGTIFEGKRGPKPVAEKDAPDRLYGEIGRLTMELDWLKKVRDQSAMTRQSWINAGDEVSVVRQRELAGVSRATIYARRCSRPEDATDQLLYGLLDEIYTRRPFYGS